MSAGTVIEGALREVSLADVLQLLDLGRKTGVLRVVDGVGARRARVRLVGGRIASATVEPPISDRADAREIVIELLGWTSGRFAMDAADDGEPLPRAATVGVDAVLMEAARRADEWARLADLVAGPEVVPALAEPADGGSATVDLAPDEWEVLAFADGVADLRALAACTRRDTLAVARAVHRLVAEGLLTVGVPSGASRSSEE